MEGIRLASRPPGSWVRHFYIRSCAFDSLRDTWQQVTPLWDCVIDSYEPLGVNEWQEGPCESS